MELYFVFIAIGTALFIIGLIALVWSVRSGQFDDLDTPALRMLVEDQHPTKPPAAIHHRQLFHHPAFNRNPLLGDHYAL